MAAVLKYAKVEHAGDVDDIKDALISIASELDSTYTNTNGDDIISEKALEAGYNSDAEYDVDIAFNGAESNEWGCYNFFEWWLDHDTCYGDWDWSCLKDDDGQIYMIMIAIEVYN